MKRWKRALGLMAVGVLGLFGCQGGETYSMTPFKVECQGVGPALCLLGLHQETAEGLIFHEGIEGFTFRWGWIQTIRISEIEVKDPPADGSSIRYVVEEVIESRRVPEEAIFTLYIDREYITGTRASGYSLIDSTRVTCATSEVCDALEQKLASPARFELTMDYPAIEGDPLIITGID